MLWATLKLLISYWPFVCLHSEISKILAEKKYFPVSDVCEIKDGLEMNLIWLCLCKRIGVEQATLILRCFIPWTHIGSSDMQGEVERAGTAEPRDEKAQGGSHLCI